MLEIQFSLVLISKQPQLYDVPKKQHLAGNGLKSATKNKTGTIVRLSSNMMHDANNETNFAHKLLLTDRQVSKLRKPFANN